MNEKQSQSRGIDRRGIPWVLQLVVPALGAFLGALATTVATEGRPSAEAGAPVIASPGKPVAVSGDSGPAGRIERVRVNLEPPRSLLYPELCDPAPPVFELEGYTAERLLSELTALKLPSKTIERLAGATRCRTGSGCKLKPDADLLRSLTKDERRAFYGFIDTLPIALEHTPFRRLTSDSNRWTERTRLSPNLVSLIQELSYDDGKATLLSDLSLICAVAASDDDRLALLATMARMPTLLVKIHVNESDDPRALSRYWSRGGRTKNLRPLFESLSRVPGGGSVDVVHLLPPFARNLLYTYPAWDDPAYNCFWSSMNFFANDPDDNYIDTETTTHVLSTQYEEVELDALELGDVIAFLDRDGVLEHTVSYVADDIVFTKNGMNVWRPWVLMELEDVVAFYPRTTLRGYRRRADAPPSPSPAPSPGQSQSYLNE